MAAGKLISGTWIVAAVAVMTAARGGAVWAQDAAPALKLSNFEPIAAELLSRQSQFAGLRLSPNRKFIAFRTSANNRSQIAVWDLAANKIARLTNFAKHNASSVRWVNDERLVISLDYEGNESFGVYAINRDGSNLRVLVEPPVIQGLKGSTVGKYVVIEGPLPGSDREVLVSANDRSARVPDLYRMDAYSGRRVLLTVDRPPEVRSWVLDNNSVPRLARSWDKERREWVSWYRASEKDAWREWSRGAPGAKGNRAIGFAADNKTVYVLSNVDRDSKAVFEFDIENKRLGKLLFEAPDGYDMGSEDFSPEPPSSTRNTGGVIFSADKGKLPIGFFFEGTKPTTVWIDEDMKRYQQAIDAALPERYNSISPAKEGERMVVLSRSDRHPGTYYWFDPKNNAMEVIAEVAPWLDESRMARVKPIEYKARDGMRIRGYLTLPPGREPRNLPLIVHPHGGPWVRDNWGFDRDLQFLASRGYAVLQMDYRISTGYGDSHFTAGFKQIGLAMQDDKTDGVNWLVSQGIADPKRVCIYGGSYGGYAALWGVTKDPDLYRCAVNLVGVADWEVIMRGLWYAGLEIYGPDEIANWIGDIDKAEDRERFDRISPVKLAGRIKAPILHGYGRNDPRVPIDHLLTMEAALRKAGKNTQSVIYENEGHGWRNPENNVDWYRRLEAFLKEHNPAD